MYLTFKKVSPHEDFVKATTLSEGGCTVTPHLTVAFNLNHCFVELIIITL